MGPPGADQHLAGSSRAPGSDLTGRGILTTKRPWTECDLLVGWVRVEPINTGGDSSDIPRRGPSGSQRLARRRHDRPSYRAPRGPRTAARQDFWQKLLAYSGPRYLVALGYVDAGNWEKHIAGGRVAVWKSPPSRVNGVPANC